jgi:hypothetical protein
LCFWNTEKAMTPQRTKNNFVSLLYALMRDHVTPGVMEKLVNEIEGHTGDTRLSNEYLAQYAEDLVKRLQPDAVDDVPEAVAIGVALNPPEDYACNVITSSTGKNFICLRKAGHDGPHAFTPHACDDCGTKHGICRGCWKVAGDTHAAGCDFAKRR